jgi:Sec-independent protein translocase protein TatA
VGFGTELIFFSVLGGLIVGPKRLHTMLGHIARAKARFEETTQTLRYQLAKELDSKRLDSSAKSSSELSEND